MSDIYDQNVRLFNQSEECDAYLLKKEHRIRGDIVIDLLKEVLNTNTSSKLKMLSVACSTGIIEQKIQERTGISVCGIDAAKESLEKAKNRGIDVKYADVTKRFPFEDESFDFVFAGEILEHLLDTRKLLREIYRVLKPSGYVIVTTPNLARFDDRIKFLFGKAPRQTSPLHPYLYLHIRPFTYGSLKESLKDAGFAGIKLMTNVFELQVFGHRIKFFPKLIMRVFPGCGATLIVRAKK